MKIERRIAHWDGLQEYEFIHVTTKDTTPEEAIAECTKGMSLLNAAKKAQTNTDLTELPDGWFKVYKDGIVKVVSIETMKTRRKLGWYDYIEGDAMALQAKDLTK